MKTPIPQIEIENLSKTYPHKNQHVKAVQNISLTINRGETLGLVGESGSGKSTLGKVILNLESPSSGNVHFEGENIHQLSKAQMKSLRKRMQVIFQDPYSSLNPRWNIEKIIGEGIDIHKIAIGQERQDIILRLMSQMKLDPALLTRYPHELSGGQKQRINIARTLAISPEFIVCDEPISALDVCTQEQVMSILIALKNEYNITYLFISHDLKAIKRISDTIAVMYLGHIVEYAPTNSLFTMPKHPYTQALLSAIPVANPFIEKTRSKLILMGDVPSPLNPPSGCPFHPRCKYAMPICSQVTPPKRNVAEGHWVACHLT